jgi:hypothetical protein
LSLLGGLGAPGEEYVPITFRSSQAQEFYDIFSRTGEPFRFHAISISQKPYTKKMPLFIDRIETTGKKADLSYLKRKVTSALCQMCSKIK